MLLILLHFQRFSRNSHSFFFPSSTLDFPYNPVAADVCLNIITTETESSFFVFNFKMSFKEKLSSDL